jgi:hypothetical protein
MLEKAEQGVWPSYEPLGYRNVLSAEGKRVIDPIPRSPKSSPNHHRLFEWSVTGRHSLREVARTARAEGVAFGKSGSPVSLSTVRKILRNPIYMGEFMWDGRSYPGNHRRLVSREQWQQVQEARVITRLRAEYDRLRVRIETMYVDKLDSRVDGTFFNRMANEWLPSRQAPSGRGRPRIGQKRGLAPRAGLEPATQRLTAACSTN